MGSGRRAVIPYEDENGPVPPPPPTLGKRLAWTSCGLVGLMGLATYLLSGLAVLQPLLWCIVFAGLACSVAALVRIRQEGWEPILEPAMIGLCLHLLIAALFVGALLVPWVPPPEILGGR